MNLLNLIIHFVENHKMNYKNNFGVAVNVMAAVVGQL